MKKIYIILVAVMSQTLISTNLSIAQGANSVNCNMPNGLTGEINQITYGDTYDNENPFVYDRGERDEGKINFRENFFYKDEGSPIANPEFKVTVAELIRLLGVLRIPSPPRPNYDPSIHYSAIRMHYGMDANAMVMIFEPVLLLPINDGNNNDDDDACTVFPTGQYFLLNTTGSLTQLPADNKTFKSLTDSFLKDVYINHRGWRNMFTHHFIDRNSWRSDTKSCIMPLQQIFKMYCDNKTATPTDLDQISFQIIANNYYRHNRSYKVHVVAFYGLGLNVENGTFQNLAADFTQLCPPNCGTIWNYKSPGKNVKENKKKEEREK